MRHTAKFLSDQPADADSFGRAAFGERLASAICLPKNSPGLVVGIEGEWGTGKTTLIKIIKSELARQSPPPIVLEFNPWLISGSDALIETLLSQLAVAIGSDPLSQQARRGIKTSEKILAYVSLLRHFKHLKYVPGGAWAGNIAEDIADVADSVITTGTKSANQLLSDVTGILPKLDLQAHKTAVIEALKRLDRPVIVIVDDLDRLLPEEVRTTLQVVKAVADFQRVTYLLAYDRRIVGNALGIGTGNFDGDSYLEKIIQVAYPLPTAFPWQLRNYCDIRVNELLRGQNIKLKSFEKKRWNDSISLASSLCRHPRDVTRLINRITISFPSMQGEVNLCDVIVFEALTQRVPDIRRALLSKPQQFTGDFFFPENGESKIVDWNRWLGVKEKDTSWKDLLPTEESERKTTEDACKFLFPLLAEKATKKLALDELRIAASDRLILLLALSSVDGVPSTREMHQWLNDTDQLSHALEIPIEDLGTTLSWINQYTPSADINNPNRLIRTLIKEELKLQQVRGYESQHASAISKLIIQVINKISADRSAIFLETIKTASLSASHDIILRAASDQGKWSIRPSERVSPSEQIIPDANTVDKAISIWCQSAENAYRSQRLHQETRFRTILYRWAQLGKDEGKVIEAVKQICHTKEGLMAFIAPYLSGQDAMDIGDFELIWNGEELADLIEKDVNIKCTSFCSQLRSEMVSQHLTARNHRLSTNTPAKI